MGSCLGLHTLTAKGVGSSPGWGTKIPETMQQGKGKKKEEEEEEETSETPDGFSESRKWDLTFIQFYWITVLCK